MFPFTFLGLTVFLLARTLALGCLLLAEAFPPVLSSYALAVITACAAFRGEVLTLVFYFQREVLTQIKAELLTLSPRHRGRVEHICCLFLYHSLAFPIYIRFSFGLPTHGHHRPPPLSCLAFPTCIPFQFSCLPFSLASLPAFLDAGS